MKAGIFIINQVDNLGRKFLSWFMYSFQVFQMTYLSVRSAIFDQAQGLRTVMSVVSTQVYFTGWQALPLITVLSVAAGSVVIMQSAFQLSYLGGQEMIGSLLVAIIVREIGPLLTALVVIARSGTAVASELGSMKVNKEIEALEAVGINPLSYIVFPRILGGVVSVLCLAFYFIFASLIGGFFVTKLALDIPFNFYFNSISQAFESSDLFLFLIKNTFSGTIIFVVSCYQGLKVQRSPNEVPQATTKAVVNSIIYVIVFNMLVTTLFYLNKLISMGVF